MDAGPGGGGDDGGPGGGDAGAGGPDGGPGAGGDGDGGGCGCRAAGARAVPPAGAALLVGLALAGAALLSRLRRHARGRRSEVTA